MTHYQIVVKDAGSNRWVFVAHGASYTKAEAEAYKKRVSERKATVKLLPIKPD